MIKQLIKTKWLYIIMSTKSNISEITLYLIHERNILNTVEMV